MLLHNGIATVSSKDQVFQERDIDGVKRTCKRFGDCDVTGGRQSKPLRVVMRQNDSGRFSKQRLLRHQATALFSAIGLRTEYDYAKICTT